MEETYIHVSQMSSNLIEYSLITLIICYAGGFIYWVLQALGLKSFWLRFFQYILFLTGSVIGATLSFYGLVMYPLSSVQFRLIAFLCIFIFIGVIYILEKMIVPCIKRIWHKLAELEQIDTI